MLIIFFIVLRKKRERVKCLIFFCIKLFPFFITYMSWYKYIDLQILTGVEINIDYVKPERRILPEAEGNTDVSRRLISSLGNLSVFLAIMQYMYNARDETFRPAYAIEENNKLVLIFNQAKFYFHITEKYFTCFIALI